MGNIGPVRWGLRFENHLELMTVGLSNATTGVFMTQYFDCQDIVYTRRSSQADDGRGKWLDFRLRASNGGFVALMS